MKKVFKIFGLFLVSVLVLCGCSSNFFINSASKNVNLYDIKIDVSCEEKTFKCVENVSYLNKTDNALTEIAFNLYPTAFSSGAVNKPVSVLNEGKAFPNGKSYGEFKINNVLLEGKPANFEFEGVDKSFLIVKLNSPLNKNSSTNLTIEFEGKLPNILHRYGYGNNTINFGNFYPIACVYENGAFVKNAYHSNGDPFYSDLANYNVQIKNDLPFVLASTGNVLNKTNDGKSQTTNIEAKAVRDFAFVLSDKFNSVSKKVGETTINYFYYDDENCDKSLQTAVDSVITFNKLYGAYPYKSLNVVKANFVYGGMEYPNLIYISDALENYEDYINTIIHETAHQWWYGLVGNNEYAYGWLDEGLTEYSTAWFYEKNSNYNIKIDDVVKNANTSYSLFVQVYEEVFGEVDTSMNRNLSEYNTEPEYVYMAYVKGMLFFDNLRELVGDNKFLKSLQSYFEMYKGKNATPQSLLKVFEKVSGCTLEGFFNSWIDGKTVVAKI